MTAFQIGSLVGGLVPVYLLTLLALWVFRRIKGAPDSVLLAVALALTVTSLIAAFGYADGGPPKYWEAFTGYILPAAIVVVAESFRVVRKRLQDG